MRRGGREALDGLSLALNAGQVTGLLGPSGSGKTTLLRSIVGVQVTDAGQVHMLGHPAGRRAVRGRVGYMTQAPALYDDLTSRENLRYFAQIFAAPADGVEEALALVQLDEAAERPVRTLSGGEKARASLATAIVGRPDVLILDEPTVGLDPLLRRDLWATFRRLAGNGATLLVSSHVMDEARYCDNLVLLREGAVFATGTPDELRGQAGTTDLSEAFLRLIERTKPQAAASEAARERLTASSA